MNRNIKLEYEISANNQEITICLTDISDTSINRHIGTYKFSDFSNSADFYNTLLLNKYDAEYDEDIATVLEELENKLVKEGYFDE